MTSPQPEVTAAALLVAYQAQAQQIRLQIEQFIRQLWRSLGLYREPQMRDFTQQAPVMVLAGQQRMASLTTAYLAQQRETVLGSSKLIPVDPAGVTGRAVRDADPTDVYSRPFHLVWQQLHDLPKQPGSIEAAIQQGEDRAVNLAQTDLQLTKTSTAQKVMFHDERASGYRRVLEGAHSCGLCIVAATAVYHRKKLMPIHPGCDCSIEPDYGEFQPGQALARGPDDELVPVGDVRDVHAAIKDRFGKSSASAKAIPGQGDLQYKDVLIEHHNSEIGPVLAVRGQKFTAV